MPMRLIKNPNGSAVMGSTEEDQAATCAKLIFRALAESGSDSAIIRAGELPSLFAPGGRVVMSRQALTNASVASLIVFLLPGRLCDQLNRDGSIQYQRPAQSDVPGEQFTVVASRRGASWSLEIARAATHCNLEIDEIAAAAHHLAARPAPLSSGDLELPAADELWPISGEHGTARRVRRA